MMKRSCRAVIEVVFRRLPVSRSVYTERDTLKERLHRLEAKFIETSAHPAGPASKGANAGKSHTIATPNFKGLDPHQLETLIPVMRTEEERIQIAERCRDADHVPKVTNSGAVIDEPDGTRVQMMHNGIKVLAGGYHGNWMQDLIKRCKGHHEPQEEFVFHEILKLIPPAATMIELGGYWSFYTIWFLSQGDARRGLVIEPDPGSPRGRTNQCTAESLHT